MRRRAERIVDAFVHTASRSAELPRSKPAETLSIHLGRLPCAVAFARRKLAYWLRCHGVDEADASDLALAFSEACANAVEHPVKPSRYAVDVEATRAGNEIRLVVRDFGDWRSRGNSPTRGRGLAMIRVLMDAVEVERGHAGTTVLMRRQLPDLRAGRRSEQGEPPDARG